MTLCSASKELSNFPTRNEKKLAHSTYLIFYRMIGSNCSDKFAEPARKSAFIVGGHFACMSDTVTLARAIKLSMTATRVHSEGYGYLDFSFCCVQKPRRSLVLSMVPRMNVLPYFLSVRPLG
jgi:hypothetical protein